MHNRSDKCLSCQLWKLTSTHPFLSFKVPHFNTLAGYSRVLMLTWRYQQQPATKNTVEPYSLRHQLSALLPTLHSKSPVQFRLASLLICLSLVFRTKHLFGINLLIKFSNLKRAKTVFNTFYALLLNTFFCWWYFQIIFLLIFFSSLLSSAHELFFFLYRSTGAIIALTIASSSDFQHLNFPSTLSCRSSIAQGHTFHLRAP